MQSGLPEVCTAGRGAALILTMCDGRKATAMMDKALKENK
jgi:hypothetical protein